MYIYGVILENILKNVLNTNYFQKRSHIFAYVQKKQYLCSEKTKTNMNETNLVYNQMIFNTGVKRAGIIYTPFSNELPSERTRPQHAPISVTGTGWSEKPDVGRTTLSKEAETPIGDSWPLLLGALFYCAWIAKRHKKHLLSFLLTILLALPTQAAITALEFTPARGGQRVTITPTISAVPSGKVAVCWSVYYDADCEHEVEDIKFHDAYLTSPNAVWFQAPLQEGTYYIKCSLHTHTGNVCDGVLDSYYVCPIEVYPADADLVLRRDAQAAGERIDITDRASKKAYGALRINKSAINDVEVSAYARYYYFISFPFDVQIEDIYGIGNVGSHWLIFFYDGKGRAEEGFFAERTDNWVMIDDTDSILHAGQGYLLQLNPTEMAQENTAVWPNNTDVATLYFPALETITALTTTDETLSPLGSAYQCTIDLSATLGSEADRRTKDSYWRCIGVPSFSSPTTVLNLPYFYEWNRTDNSLNVTSSTGHTFLPMHAYLVQNGGEITWKNVQKPSSPMHRHTEPLFDEWRLDILQGDESQDRTFIRMKDEDATTAFDFGQDLIKELNPGKANIYSMLGYERLAANVLPSGDNTLSLGVTIAVEDDYTFSMPQGTGATLIDHTAGISTNLALTNYTIHLTPGTHDARFSLSLFPHQGPSTSINNQSDQPHPKKVLINGLLYIVTDSKLYNANGFLIQKQ